MNCKECNAPFEPNREWQKFCSSYCQNKHNRRKSNAKKMANSTPQVYHYDTEESYTLLHDPLPFSQGGFRKGAVFTKTQLNQMLLKRVIYAGSVLEEDVKLFEIRANERGKLRLE